ncbi:MAG: hypothetical protein RL409_484, partial [Gemmatimonadota bacterium]
MYFVYRASERWSEICQCDLDAGVPSGPA